VDAAEGEAGAANDTGLDPADADFEAQYMSAGEGEDQEHGGEGGGGAGDGGESDGTESSLHPEDDGEEEGEAEEGPSCPDWVAKKKVRLTPPPASNMS
jgi:hypothetical protein